MKAPIKLGISLVFLILFLIPTWIFLIAYTLLDPGNFWQRLAVGTVGLFFLGSTQIVLIFCLLGALLNLWSNDF